MLKRSFDLILAISSLLILSPVWTPVVIVVIVAYKGKKIIFAQKRIGLHGRAFVLYKFRTLKSGTANKIGHCEADETILGKVLRKFSLDELPQFINVIKGEMSIVGPRPLPVEYREIIEDRYRWRMALKPGITGLVQVKGRNRLSWEERFEKDYWYFKNRSLMTDLKIIFLTFLVLFKAEGNVQSEKLI